MIKSLNRSLKKRTFALCLLKCIDESIENDLTPNELDNIIDSLYFSKHYNKLIVSEFQDNLDRLVASYNGRNLESSSREKLRYLLDQLVSLHYHSDISRITTMVAVMIIIQTYEQIYNGICSSYASRSESITKFVMSKAPEDDIDKQAANRVLDGNNLPLIKAKYHTSILNLYLSEANELLVSNLSREGSIAFISTIFMLERCILVSPKNFRRIESRELLNQAKCMFYQEGYTELPKIERCNKVDSVVVGLGTCSAVLLVAGVTIPVLAPEELVIILIPSILLSIALPLGAISLTRLIVNAHVPDKFVEANAQPAANSHILELMDAV